MKYPAKRFILHEKIAGTFVERFRKELGALVPGDPTGANTTLGPLSGKGALELVEKQIQMAADGGAKVLMGGKRLVRPGYFPEPTILTGITSDL
jgi:succinate-semialdehyde dehydrogenase / glutarate-semialdehyde dehydrogenase